MDKLRDIEIKYLEDIIPNILLKKFERHDIKKIDDILNLSKEEFRKYEHVGKNIEKYYEELKNKINNEPDLIINCYKEKLPKLLPLVFDEKIDVLNLFKSIIEDYLTIIKNYQYKTEKSERRYKRDIEVIRKYYGLKSKKYNSDKIARRYRIERERVRQIITNEFLSKIKSLINGEFLDKWNCECRQESIELIQSYKKDIAGTPVLNEYILSDWLKDYGSDLEEDDIKNYFTILLNAWGYEQIGLSRYYHLQDNCFYVDESIDKELFLNVSTKIYNFLRKQVIPVSFDDIVIEVLEEFDVEDDFIKLACDINYNFEKINDEFYQIRFENLSNINDYVYRLLYEKRKTLTFNEILHSINKRLLQVNKDLTIESLKQNLKSNEFIVPIGKTGSWTLKDLNTNIESQIDLILKTFRTLDKPLTVQEITHHINENYLRTDVSARSVAANLRNYKKHFIKLRNNRFALKETIGSYKNEVVDTRVPRKKKAKLKREIIAEKAIEILENTPNNKMLLRDLISVLLAHNNNYIDKEIYRVVNENPLVFKKQETNNKNKIVILKTKKSQYQDDLNARYKWNELKGILKRELESIFSSSSQTNYNITLENALDAFFKLVTVDLTEDTRELEELADRIIPTLKKFFLGTNDRNDKLNYLKQIVTSQESYFKKLLYFIDIDEFHYVKTHNKGFGTVLEKLDRIDPRKNRHKDLRTASTYQFGKHCSRAYNNRNIDTHNANRWTEAEIIQTKTSCLVLMVYGAFEYYEEIERI